MLALAETVTSASCAVKKSYETKMKDVKNLGIEIHSLLVVKYLTSA